jgi:hypothetical protein
MKCPLLLLESTQSLQEGTTWSPPTPHWHWGREKYTCFTPQEGGGGRKVLFSRSTSLLRLTTLIVLPLSGFSFLKAMNWEKE